MLVGNGLLAKKFKSFKNDDNMLIFASGVSNSKETLSSEFLREEKLLLKYLKLYSNEKKFIYFSTCSIYDNYFEISMYTKHKMKMEEIIKKNSKSYYIFRLPQVLGKSNKYQLVNFFYNSIIEEQKFDLFDIERNLIDIDDIYLLVQEIIFKDNFVNKVINLANPENMTVVQLVKIIEELCGKKGKYNIIEKKGDFKIDLSEILLLIKEKNIFEDNYIFNRIKKYYI